MCKALALGSLYGKGPHSLAIDIGRPVGEAKAIMKAHKLVYRQYWSWIENVVDSGLLELELETLLGWKYRIPRTLVIDPKTGREKSVKNSLLNFPMQSNGAEMLRIAAVLAYYAGIKIVALVHDAIMIEADLEELEEAAAVTARCMDRAARSLLVNTGLPTIGVDCEFVKSGRYMDDRGLPFWTKLWEMAGRIFDDVPVVVDTIVS
jgi:DNA polymerase I-like protein with 3'-5' exonuclease and polymerase domains